MRPTVDDIEIRVLGVLMEKSLTQASTYPMTMNAIVLGANQKQNRDPVVEMSEGDVARALTRLQQKRLVKQAPPSAGARSNRFLHTCVEAFQWDRRQQAIMSELFLRGRQTPGEPRTHASRMTPFPDLDAIGNTLNDLSNQSPPFVEELLREPGRSANRWRHLLGSEEQASSGPALPNPSATAFRAPSVGASPLSAELPLHQATSPPAPTLFRPDRPTGDLPSSSQVDLIDRVEKLEAQVAELVETVSELHNRVDLLTGDTAPKVVE